MRSITWQDRLFTLGLLLAAPLLLPLWLLGWLLDRLVDARVRRIFGIRP